MPCVPEVVEARGYSRFVLLKALVEWFSLLALVNSLLVSLNGELAVFTVPRAVLHGIGIVMYQHIILNSAARNRRVGMFLLFIVFN